MNYLAKFGMEYNPFIKNNNRIKLELNEYKQLLFRLKHLEDIKGLGIITGEPGLGKTTAVRSWCDSLNKSMYKIIYINHTTLTALEFLRILSDELNLDTCHSARKNFRAIQDEVKRLYIEKKITPLIILDEANYLNNGVLNEIKLLLNFDMDSKDRFIILLVGQNNLRNILNLKSNEALRQRIVLNYSLSQLSKDESKIYIDSKLKESGLNQEIISNEAYNQIINYSNGVMRIIDQIMDKALLILSNMKENIITGEMAMEAINEYSL